MYLIQLLLPLHDNNKREFPPDYFATVRKDLMERFGGVRPRFFDFRRPVYGKKVMTT
jgi:hypothetical protein